MNREELEQKALMTVSPDIYYDLADTIDNVTDDELYKLIDCDGDVEYELRLTATYAPAGALR
jgi:hypothetical protein